MLTGQNGILNRAGEAKDETERSQQEELEKLAGMEALTNINGYEYQGVNIPAGYIVSSKEGENSLEDGLVIKDASGNEFVWVEVSKDIYTNTTYNKDNAQKPTSKEDYTNIEKCLEEYTKSYKSSSYSDWTDEWYAWDEEKDELIIEGTATEEQKLLSNGCGLTLNDYKKNKEKMLKSIYENGGFWISRYEIGDEIGTKNNYKTRASEDEPLNQTPVSKPNQVPYIYVTCSQAQGLASKMTQESTVTSSLLFGIQWDLVCKYLEGKDGLTKDKINSNSGTWGNYFDNEITLKRGKYVMISNFATWFDFNQDATGPIPVEKGKKKAKIIPILLTTGASDDTKKQNIYDLAGNLFEWTLEHATSSTSAPCAFRGGNFSDVGAGHPASDRGYTITSYSYTVFGCRVALY